MSEEIGFLIGTWSFQRHIIYKPECTVVSIIIILMLDTVLNIKSNSCSRVTLDMMIVAQLLMKLITFYGTRRSIAGFTRARHLTIDWVSCVNSTTSLHFKPNFNIILTSSPFSRGLFSLVWPTKILCVFVVYHCVSCPSHISLLV